LRVIARESSFRFRGTDVDLGGLNDVLGAGFCLSGRVEQFAGRLIVSVDLADTRNGSLIWSEHFERPIDDIHAVRAEIVSALINALDLQIPLAEAALARQKPVEHLDAWGAYHLGLSHMYRFNRHDNAIAAGLFKRATDLDPGFASAFAMRSFTSQQNAAMAYTHDRDANLHAARAEAERSQELDPFDPAANMAMGRLHLFDGRPEDGVMWLDRAVDLSPSFAKGHYSRAFLNVLAGRPDQTRSGISIAMGLSPLDPMMAPMRMIRGLSYVVEGNYAAAAENAIQSMGMARTHYLGLLGCVALCHLADRDDAAQYWATVLRDLRPDASVGDFVRGIPFADPNLRQTVGEAIRAMGFPD
jgi:tetratricopeptide (TPR) repeat protein